jgi:hypothetical protein
LGVGAALATGQGVAHADDAAKSEPASDTSQPAKPHPLSQLKKDISALTAQSGASSPAARSSLTSSSTGSPRSVVAAINKQVEAVTSHASAAKRPLSVFGGGSTNSPAAGVATLAKIELNNAVTRVTDPNPAPTPGAAPAPGDVATSPLIPVSVGKWMLQESDGQISNWGGQPYGGRTLLEPVNVVILDPNSKSPEESTAKLNRDMTLAGFPAQPIHSTGFMGLIGGATTHNPDGTYTQQPADGSDAAYSDNLFIFPNNHARAFGPAPVPAAEGSGYVWTVAASTETPSIYNGALTHSYLSSNLARDILVLRLLLTGQATFVGVVPMGNEYNTETETTGDHDGNAIVLQLK